MIFSSARIDLEESIIELYMTNKCLNSQELSLCGSIFPRKGSDDTAASIFLALTCNTHGCDIIICSDWPTNIVF